MSEGMIGVGVAGCGYWGPNLARNFSVLPGSKLVGLADANVDRLAATQAHHSGAAAFTSFTAMLKDPEVDAVAIATPFRTHYPLAKEALLAGKHVLVEKPLAMTSEQCGELAGLAESSGLTLMVDHTFVYSAAVKMIRGLIDSGEIGDVRYINSQRLNLGIFQKDCNVVWDLAPHDLAVILHLVGGMPASVNCVGNAHITPGVEDVANISLQFPGGQFATIQNSWLEPRKVRQMTIVGTKKMIVYDDIEPSEKIRIYDARVDRPPHFSDFGEFHYAYHYGDCYIPRIEQWEPLRAMCGHFIRCVESGCAPGSGGREGEDVVGILEACDRSSAAGGAPVEVPMGSSDGKRNTPWHEMSADRYELTGVA